jgi:hypothetical protein
MKPKWHYSGDMVLDNGGFFYDLSDFQYGYANAVKITPCSDAGGQDNAWWIEVGTINLPDDKRRDEALRSYGVDGVTIDPEDLPHVMIQACEAYLGLECEHGGVVQIGPDDPYCREVIPPNQKLRAGTDLEKWVRRHYLKG